MFASSVIDHPLLQQFKLDNVCAATAHRITLNFACLSCQFPVVPEVTGRSTFEPNSAGLLWELTMANPLPLCIVDS